MDFRNNVKAVIKGQTENRSLVRGEDNNLTITPISKHGNTTQKLRIYGGIRI